MSTPPSTPTTAVSAPGKVLIAGGYLVLDPKYRGTVISTSSRFYTVIHDQKEHGANRIVVRSPQFVDAKWEYEVKVKDEQVLVQDAETNTSKNKFVHLALRSTIALAAEISGIKSVTDKLENGGIDIAVVGDNDFYSQREKLASLNLDRTLASLAQIPPFTSTGVPLRSVHKTGLGSSAALITSLVSALLLHFGAIPSSSFDHAQPSEGQLLAHNLAQYVHCLAQGKVGSGFDVAAAVFGTHLYTRFEPGVLECLMKDDAKPQLLKPILEPSNRAWNYRTEPFKLPPLIKIMLADVDAGSDTPSLVGKVLKWRSEKSAEALKLWTELDQLNQHLADTLANLTVLHDKDPEFYHSAVKYIASVKHIQWDVTIMTALLDPEEKLVIERFCDTYHITQGIRFKMREMGKLSDVPIEPPEQTKLLDSCISLAGVIGGGVPGAGGYDAIWLLVCDPIQEASSPDKPPSARVESIWAVYKDLNVSPLSATASVAGGARVEDLEKVKGLKEAVALTSTLPGKEETTEVETKAEAQEPVPQIKTEREESKPELEKDKE